MKCYIIYINYIVDYILYNIYISISIIFSRFNILLNKKTNN